MPSCAVIGCKNSSRKKVKMCYIPREERIRTEWLRRINREGWVPSDTSAICQYHFEPCMWEIPRQDGKLKLKNGAFPTIFGDRVLQVRNAPLQPAGGGNIHGTDGRRRLNESIGSRVGVAHENDHTEAENSIDLQIQNSTRVTWHVPEARNQIPHNERVLAQISTNAQPSHRPLCDDTVTDEGHALNNDFSHETTPATPFDDDIEIGGKPPPSDDLLDDTKPASSTSTQHASNIGISQDNGLLDLVRRAPIVGTENPHTDADEEFIRTCDIESFIDANNTSNILQSITHEAVSSNDVEDDFENFEQLNSSKTLVETNDDNVHSADNGDVAMNEYSFSASDDEDTLVQQDADSRRSPTKEELLEKMKKMEKVYLKSKKMNSILKKRLVEERKTVKKLQEKVRMFESSCDILRKFLNSDQIELLARNYKKLPSWCDETLVKAYSLKFACGCTGYEELLRQGWPLPSLRTLSRKLEGWYFESGPNEEIWKFLEIKVSHFPNDIFCHCVLVLDEFSIKEGERFNPLTGKYVGRPTLPGHENSEELAKNVLVFMLAGIANRWKQIIEYYYTGSAVDATVYREIVDRIITKAESLPKPLNVDAIVNDMGSGNQRMWSCYGINASRYSRIMNSCVHPCDENRKLYFFHDPVHAFKNLKEGLKNNRFVIVPDEYVQKYELPTNVVQFDHFKDLSDLQRDCDLKLAPKLRDEYLDTSNNHYLKMRVKNASHVVSLDVASGLEYISYKFAKHEYRTTAWLVYIFAKWFKLMTSRNLAHCLSKMQPERLTAIVYFLKEVMDIVSKLKFGESGHWKPFQTGILISTKSVLQLSIYLLKDKGYEFVLPGRFTQDCLENVFFVFRKRQSNLDSIQFVQILRIICVSQYMKWSPNSNYDEDDRVFIPDFLKVLCESRIRRKNVKRNNHETVEIPESEEEITIDGIQLNVLHHIAGYIMHSIEENEKVCENCMNYTRDENENPTDYNELTRLRSKYKNKLFYLNERTFNFFIMMEVTYRTDIEYAKRQNCDLIKFFSSQFMELPYYLPDCHHLKHKICQRFIRFRLKVACKKDRAKRCYSSKTMAAHSIVQ